MTAAAEAMLAEQSMSTAADARLNPVAFALAPQVIAASMQTIDAEAEKLWTDWRFARLVSSLVQDAGRAAQGVDTATRPRVGHVRHLQLPSCSRCAVLAGRVYRHSTGFKRHPGCDCTMVPTALDSGLTYDPQELAEQGLVTGLSRADRAALADGADFNQVANARRSPGDLRDASGYLSRAGRLTPAGIYQMAGNDRAKALGLLKAAGYIT